MRAPRHAEPRRSVRPVGDRDLDRGLVDTLGGQEQPEDADLDEQPDDALSRDGLAVAEGEDPRDDDAEPDERDGAVLAGQAEEPERREDAAEDRGDLRAAGRVQVTPPPGSS